MYKVLEITFKIVDTSKGKKVYKYNSELDRYEGIEVNSNYVRTIFKLDNYNVGENLESFLRVNNNLVIDGVKIK